MLNIKDVDNILIQGDCLEAMRDIPDGSVDMCLTDPPYQTTACKWDTIIPLEPMWEQLKRVIKPNGAIVMTASQPFTTTLIASNMKMFKYCWVWDKVRPSGFQIAKYRPMMQHEDIIIFGTSKTVYNRQMVKRPKPETSRVVSSSGSSPLKYNDGKPRTYTHWNPRSILIYNKGSDGKYVHPTQKPVALMEYLIKTYTNEGETVLDFAAGSFTTGVACVNLNRKFIGIEQDAGYFKIGQDRIQEATDSMGLFQRDC